MNAREGDLFVRQTSEGWHVLKILRIAPFGEAEPTAHVLTYEALAERPSLVSLSDARILTRHAPIALTGVTQEAKLLGNLPVTAEELAGYHEYLKRTDFAAYIRETGKTRSEILPLAQAAYLEGNRLSEEKQFEEALAAYDQSLDHFPLYIEAIDNRALTLMDLGRLQEAVAGFEQSLRIQPDNPGALFQSANAI